MKCQALFVKKKIVTKKNTFLFTFASCALVCPPMFNSLNENVVSAPCEDAPCCGCCGGYQEDYSPDDESDALRAREEADYYADMEGRNEFYREEAEDRYLDTYWEDQSEYGMEGCCGDF